MIFNRIDKLREGVANSTGKRPAWVGLEFVRTFAQRRIDIRFEWALGGECFVHTDAIRPRDAIRQVVKVAHHVQPGRRFRADSPEHFEMLS